MMPVSELSVTPAGRSGFASARDCTVACSPIGWMSLASTSTPSVRPGATVTRSSTATTGCGSPGGSDRDPDGAGAGLAEPVADDVADLVGAAGGGIGLIGDRRRALGPMRTQIGCTRNPAQTESPSGSAPEVGMEMSRVSPETTRPSRVEGTAWSGRPPGGGGSIRSG